MHVLRNSAPRKAHYGNILPAGEWLMQDQDAFALAKGAERGTVKLDAWSAKLNHDWIRLDDSANVDGTVTKSILLIRSGAIGDLLLLTPAVRALSEKYPAAQIWLSCHKKHWDILAQGDTHFVEYPLPVSELTQFDLIMPLEDIVELSTENGQHATDAFAEALGVTVTDYRPEYHVTTSETIDAPDRIDKPRVALQLHASSIIRNYPVQLWIQVIQLLVNRGWEIMLMGSQDSIKGAPPAVKDCSKLSFREAAAVLATCDVFCGVDSSFFNLCPALGVPAVGLFGPVDWRTRVKEGSGQVALHGEAECAPCGWTNSRGGVIFPAEGPCSKTGYCQPLSEIKPERIVAMIEKVAKK